MVCGSDSSKAIQSRASDYHIIGRRAIYYQEIDLLHSLLRMSTCYDLKGDHSKRIDTGSCKTDQRGFDGLQLILINFHLLEGRQVYDVCRAAIVNQNPSGGIASDLHCDNQRVIMGVEDFAGVLFCKCNRKVFHPRFLVAFLRDKHIVYLLSVSFS